MSRVGKASPGFSRGMCVSGLGWWKGSLPLCAGNARRPYLAAAALLAWAVMSPRDPTLATTPPVGAWLDRESAGWLRALAGAGVEHDEAIARLHELLLRVALGEVRRRRRQ